MRVTKYCVLFIKIALNQADTIQYVREKKFGDEKLQLKTKQHKTKISAKEVVS